MCSDSLQQETDHRAPIFLPMFASSWPVQYDYIVAGDIVR